MFNNLIFNSFSYKYEKYKKILEYKYILIVNLKIY